MKYNGLNLVSRGKEEVYVYGEKYHRTVWELEGQWKFYTRINGEFIEVYHKACWFSTTP